MANPFDQFDAPLQKRAVTNPFDQFDAPVPRETPTTPLQIGASGFPAALRETLRGTDWATRNIAGAGTALSDLYQGAKQLIGQGDPQQIQANDIMAQEAPIGAFAGNVAATAIPFGLAGKSLKAAGLVGGGFGALQPVSGDQSAGNVAQGKAINAGIGAATAMAGQAVANKATDWVSQKIAELAAQKARNTPLDNTIKEALDAGYVLPPGQVNPTFLNKRLESAAGKVATQQVFSKQNAETTDRLARMAAGLAPDEPITAETLKAARTPFNQVYEGIKNAGPFRVDSIYTPSDLGPEITPGKVFSTRQNPDGVLPKYSKVETKDTINGEDAINSIRELRSKASSWWQAYSRDLNPDTQAKAVAYGDAAKEIEGLIERNLSPEKLQEFKAARVALAKNHAVDEALIEGGGTIDARNIAKLAQRREPLTGELAIIGNFANNFKKLNQPANAMGTPDAHNLRHILSAMAGGGGFMGGGIPGALAGVAMVEGAPIMARKMMMSQPMQQSLVRDYTLGTTPRTLADLLRYAPVGGAVTGLQTLGQ